MTSNSLAHRNLARPTLLRRALSTAASATLLASAAILSTPSAASALAVAPNTMSGRALLGTDGDHAQDNRLPAPPRPFQLHPTVTSTTARITAATSTVMTSALTSRALATSAVTSSE